MNNFNGIGNLTQDPQCRDVGKSVVCNFAMAINEYATNKNGERTQKPLFLDVETWNKSAENAKKYLQKGSSVGIQGRLKQNSWEKNGQKFTKIVIIADKIEYLDKRQKDDGQSSQEAPPSRKAVEQEQSNVENSFSETDDLEDIEDIPF